MQDFELSKLQFSVVVELGAPIETCFEAAYLEEAMSHWVPGHKNVVYDHSLATEPYGAGAERRVTLKSGMSMIERICTSHKPDKLIYCIPSFGMVGDRLVSNYYGYMNFEALGDDKTCLTWNGYFDCHGLQRLTEPLMRMGLRKLVSTMAHNIQDYLLVK